MFRPGTSEIVAGERIADGFDAGLGEQLRFGGRQWTLVGIFEAGRSGFASEIWGDVEQFMAKHGKPDYASGQVRCVAGGSNRMLPSLPAAFKEEQSL